MKKKIFALLLAMVMIVGLLPVTAWAATGWDGTTTVEPAKVGEVYQIGTAEELAWFSCHVNTTAARADSAVLISDINLYNKQWTPIGTQTSVGEQYKGTFDGQGHTISGLKIEIDATNQGLFGAVNGATIKNLDVSGVINCGNKNYIGGVVGKMQAGSIENCSFGGSVKGGYTGGIAGYLNAAGVTIKGCANYGAVNGTYAGGILG